LTTNIIRLVNGESTDHVALDDRGLQYGDGCFETIAVQRGRALLWEQHLSRLQSGCERLGIDIASVVESIKQEMEQLVAGIDRAVLKIIITRGQGGRGYRAQSGLLPTRILSLSPWPVYPQDYRATGIALRLCDTRLSENRKLAGIKHLNRLEQVLARAEWQDEYQEGLMLSQSGDVIEGTMSNVFAQTGDKVVTPLIETCGVAGIMRETIIKQLSKTGVTCEEARVDQQTLYNADAIFISNSLIGLWPVTALENKTFSITELERQLQDALTDVCVTG